MKADMGIRRIDPTTQAGSKDSRSDKQAGPAGHAPTRMTLLSTVRCHVYITFSQVLITFWTLTSTAPKRPPLPGDGFLKVFGIYSVLYRVGATFLTRSAAEATR